MIIIISLIDCAIYENSSFVLLTGKRNPTCPSQRIADSLAKNRKLSGKFSKVLKNANMQLKK